jgi:hypothetical protein
VKRFDFNAQVKTIALKRWDFRTQWCVHPDLIESFGPERAFDFDGYMMRLCAYVWGTVDSEERHEFPATWWDAVKQRWFPKWALRRWPVNLTVVSVRRGIIYPELSPGSGRGVGAAEIYIRRVVDECES